MMKKRGGRGMRRRAHIRRGGRAFLPQGRMRRIRWEESVANVAARREGRPRPVLHHLGCSCGSIECQGVPTPVVS